MVDFLSGMSAMGSLVAGLFFFRFWRRTGDTLFVYFGISFWLLAITQVVAMLLDSPHESQSWIYLIRLAAFVVLIVGIVSKNVKGSGPRNPAKPDTNDGAKPDPAASKTR